MVILNIPGMIMSRHNAARIRRISEANLRRTGEVCLSYTRNGLRDGKNDFKNRRLLKFLKARVVSTPPFRNHRHSIPHFVARFPWTYKTVLSYASSTKKQCPIRYKKIRKQMPNTALKVGKETVNANRS